MSVELHVGSRYAGKVEPAALSTQKAIEDPEIAVTPHNTTDRTGAPRQPLSRRSLERGAITRLLGTVDDTLRDGAVAPTTVFAAAECGVRLTRTGFVTETVAAVAVYQSESGISVALGRAGGVKVPARDVFTSLLSRGKVTVGEAMSKRLGGGDPQDPHQMLGHGRRADQVGRAFDHAFSNLGPPIPFLVGSTVM